MEKTLEKISSWWNQEYNGNRALIRASMVKADVNPVDMNQFWQSAGLEPDIEGLAGAQIESLSNITFLAESYPSLPHLWGSRGTPMTMAAYLGGKVNFTENTVWIDPVIEDWEKFEVRFNPDNYWVRQSRRLMECQMEKCGGKLLVWMPDFGDALTVFSMLRGVERLLIDITETPDLIKKKVFDFVRAWKEAHTYFHSLYRKILPGDCSWALWAPGRTYACQCDFSTMISPKRFEEFVVPEIREIGKYLDYIIWHLDGPDEIRHLDILLALPEIKAIQVVPGAGRPPCVSPLWMSQMKKIQEKGKLVFAYAENRDQLRILTRELSPEKLFVGCADFFSSDEEIDQFLKENA